MALDKLFTLEEANVLTTEGFAAQVERLRNNKTRMDAYEATEVIHQRVHFQHKRKYSDYDSFRRLARLSTTRTSGRSVAMV